jgi:hypothetical protein
MGTMTTIYLKHRDGGTHQLSGKRLATLRREILAGRGGLEVTALTMAGYIGFIGADGEVWDFEALSTEFTAEAR